MNKIKEGYKRKSNKVENGEIQLSKEIIEHLGIKPGKDAVQFELNDDDTITITKAQ